MRCRVIYAFVLLIILSVTMANAGDRTAIGVRAGTLGLGAEFDVKLTNHFTVRMAANSYDYSNTIEDSGINFDATLELGSVGAMIDYYPFSNGFHLTAGAFKNDNRLMASGVPEAGQTFEIGENFYTTTEIGDLSSRMEFKDTVPYFGLGWGNPFNGRRFGVNFDLGVFHHLLLCASATISWTARMPPEMYPFM